MSAIPPRGVDPQREPLTQGDQPRSPRSVLRSRPLKPPQLPLAQRKLFLFHLIPGLAYTEEYHREAVKRPGWWHTLQSGEIEMDDPEFKASLDCMVSITNEQTLTAHAIFCTRQKAELALSLWPVSSAVKMQMNNPALGPTSSGSLVSLPGPRVIYTA